tara:strand:- start:5235 stop:6092 length:858 start_codon:yes stop_codon:yes gene_type:complete
VSSKGYLVIAQNNDQVDYIRQAYALALSIKNTQTINQFAIAVEPGTKIPDEYREVFDHVVKIPWTDQAEGKDWKIQNKWKYYYMTPFDETVILDTDMIFTADISFWWDYLSEREAWFTTNVKTYRGTDVTSDYYRKTFTSNQLPNVYTAFAYFKKTERVAELFQLVELIFQNWEKFFFEFLDNTKPDWLSGDVAYALAIKLLGLENDFTQPLKNVPTFVHMKSQLQDHNNVIPTEEWTKHIPSYFKTTGDLKIGNFRQFYPVHYHDKAWLTDIVIKRLEDIYNEK